MKLTKNVIAFRKDKMVTTSELNSELRSLAVQTAAELMQFGYLAQPEDLCQFSESELITFHDEVLDYLKEIIGDGNYHPLYNGFPKQVMELSDEELWLNQIIHYWSLGTWIPDQYPDNRGTAFEHPKFTKLSVMTEDEFDSIFTDLCSVNQSLTDDDLSVIKWYVESERALVFPSNIPFKENLMTLAAMGLEVPVRTTTDVLRIAVSLSGGDISLPAVPPAKVQKSAWSKTLIDNSKRASFKFKKFTRPERRYLLRLLENSNCDVHEMSLKCGRWIRLGEVLHPGEYSRQFPRTAKAFEQLRNEKVTSWYGEVEAAFNNSFQQGLQKLAQRPGEFARRIDALLRNFEEEPFQKETLTAFSQVAEKVSNKVLFELWRHFENRRFENSNRKIMIKGCRKKIALPSLPIMNADLIEQVQNVIIEGIKTKLKTLDPLGNIWIDPQLSKLPLPTNMRSLQSSLKPKIRGERIPMDNSTANVMRFYVHWKDETGNEDLDLSATLIGLGKVDFLAWNNGLRKTFGCHSGDVRFRKGDCVEYVDINIQRALSQGFRYVVIDVNNFQGRGFDTLFANFGWMEREKPEHNLIWFPQTVVNAFRLTSTANTVIMAIIDLSTKEIIFVDEDKQGLPVATHNLDAYLQTLSEYLYPPKLSVFQLLQWHAEARNATIITNNSTEDDNVQYFRLEDFNQSYVEILKWMGV